MLLIIVLYSVLIPHRPIFFFFFFKPSQVVGEGTNKSVTGCDQFIADTTVLRPALQAIPLGKK